MTTTFTVTETIVTTEGESKDIVWGRGLSTASAMVAVHQITEAAAGRFDIVGVPLGTVTLTPEV